MLHCDYHTNNVLKQNGETLLIDMDTLSYGHPIFDLTNVFDTYVGFGEFEPQNVEEFLYIPYETAKKIWTLFLPMYLKTENPEKLKEIENKTRVLGYLRIIRHFTSRDNYTPQRQKEIAQEAAAKIDDLMPEVSSLMF